MRRVLTKLLAQEWPPEFRDGLVILVRQLTEIERSSAPGVDAKLLRSLLPVLDALERARAQARWIDPARVMTFENALGALTDLLAEHEAIPDRPLGQDFDPRIHEAIGTRVTSPEGRVLKVEQRGWVYRTQRLRPSKVVVSKRSAPEDLAA